MLGAHQEPIGLRSRVAELASNPNTKALVVGATAVAVTPLVLPLVKPALKATIKTGVTLYEKAKMALSETGELLADVAAEARAEVQADSQKKTSLQAATSSPEANATE
ncbi:MAG: DUF5132 domain-containing protein [Leptolyngbya sp. SIO1E4]|nr:DUF5132 domain-containing protein [Leptolyngbya sp. SIO1E4]